MHREYDVTDADMVKVCGLFRVDEEEFIFELREIPDPKDLNIQEFLQIAGEMECGDIWNLAEFIFLLEKQIDKLTNLE